MKTTLLLLLLGAALRATGQGRPEPFAPTPDDPWPGFGLPPAHRLMPRVPTPAPPSEAFYPHASKAVGARITHPVRANKPTSQARGG